MLANKQRTYFETEEIDHNMVHNICNRLGEKELKIYRHIATGGMWSETNKIDTQVSDGKCKHCGAANVDNIHTIWQCPKINEHRKLKCEQIDNPKYIPKCILQGIPSVSCSVTASGERHYKIIIFEID